MSQNIFYSAVSGSPLNNGSTVSILYGKSKYAYNFYPNIVLNTTSIGTKYDSRFSNDIEYILWPSSGNILPTPTVTSTPSQTLTPTPTLTPSQTPHNVSGVLLMSNTANYDGCAGDVANVGTTGRSSFYGTYDMSGNIWEWNEDIAASTQRVFRGGNFTYPLAYLSSTTRNYGVPSYKLEFLGFRVGSYANDHNQTQMSFVEDTDNASDSNGFGSVSYSYYIGKYEITNANYVEFLNAVAVNDTKGLFDSFMSSSAQGGIIRSGTFGNFSYSVKNNRGNRPVNFVSWYECARYCNWLHNNKPTGQQDVSTTEDGAYDMAESYPIRKNTAKYFIPTENEWYKAAFYKGGSSGGYWLYATQSDTAPSCIQINLSGDGILS